MKKIAYIFAALTSLIGVSCTSNDDNGNGTSPDYLPQTTGNYWVYNTTLDGTSNGRDSLYIAGDTTISAVAYKKFKTKDVATGFFSGALSGNGVRKSGTQLLVTGSTSINFSADFPVNLNVTDFPFLDSAAASGTQVGSTSGTINQATTSGYTIVADYTLKSVAGENLASYTTPDNITYTDVKAMNLVLNLKITANVDLGGGLTVPVYIMNAQDVVTSTQYYAKNIGNVYTNTVLTYELADLSSFSATLPIPQSDTYTQTETLQTYHVN